MKFVVFLLIINIIGSSDEFLKICSNNFIAVTKTNQVVIAGESINEEWFQWGQLYSFCMQYETATKNTSGQLDVNCRTTQCRNCMEACSIPLPFNLSACQANCSSVECCSGCKFYSDIKSGIVKSDHNNKPVTDNDSIQIQEKDVISLTFKWHNILSKSSPVLSSLYLIVLVSESSTKQYKSSTKKHINVIGLSARNECVITKEDVCSSYTSIYDKYKETKYKLEIYPINFNGYNSSTFIQSNYTNLAHGSQIRNLTISSKPGFIAKSRPLADKISWNMTWSPPSTDLTNGTKIYVRIQVVECAVPKIQEINYDMNASPVTISVDTMDKDEMKGCIIQVLAETKIEPCILGESSTQRVKYDGCHTIIDHGCSFVHSTILPVQTNQPITPTMVTITKLKSECLNPTIGICYDGKRNSSCKVCTALEYILNVQWQQPSTPKPIQQYTVRWGEGISLFGNYTTLTVENEINRTIVSFAITTFNITGVRVVKDDFRFAVQIIVWTGPVPDGNFLSISGYKEIRLNGPSPVIPFQHPVVNAASDSNETEKIILGVMIPLVLITLGFIVVLYILYRRRPDKNIRGMSFLKSRLDMYMDQDEIPADEWEIFPKNIILDEKIGQGAFGTVFSATIDATFLSKSQYAKQKGGTALLAKKNCKVAVKLLKDGASQLQHNDFKEEISLMKDIGYHKNIINLIGCSTVKNPLCLIVEFMEHGDLLHFLRKRRTELYTAKTSEECNTQSYMQMSSPTPQNANENSEIEGTPESVSSEPDDIDSIAVKDLLSFAWQICCGMEYLAQHNLVHRDLAARNLLVGADRVVKVSDFGLARAVSTDLIYMSNTNRKLPIKWMSVEAIFDQVFTTYSDVWAYGVVLFEIITLGGTPYPAINNRELLGMLKSGYRMDKPENCTDLMYDIMLHCWNEDPLQRPTFTELREHLEDIMMQDDRYFSFDINEDNTYYNVASFKSVPSDEEIDDQVIDDEIMQKPIQVKTIDDLKKSQEKQDGEDIIKKLQEHDVKILVSNDNGYSELQALGSISPVRSSCVYVNSDLKL